MVVEDSIQLNSALSALCLTIKRVEKMIEAMPPFSARRTRWQNGLSNLNDLRRVMEGELNGPQ